MTACYDQSHRLVPEDPAKLEGPELGTVCILRGKSDFLAGKTVRVLERSYVWAPEQHNADGSHGYRHYDWSVVSYGDTPREQVVVNDRDLEPV